jgi:sugar lactone lactonase YvrE
MKTSFRIFSLRIFTALMLFTSLGAGSSLHAQIITTIAGTGTAGFNGDGGPATAADVNHPEGVAVDRSGNVYFAERDNYRVRRISAATGVISTIAGTGISGFSGDGGAATSAQLSEPFGVAVDGSGNIYIVDTGNNRIRKITAATGFISTIAGSDTATFSGDGGLATAARIDIPLGLALDGSGNIYLSEPFENRIRKITAATGFISTIAGNGTYGFSGDGAAATAAELHEPDDVAVDGSGNVYIGDHSNQRIRKITASTGVISTIAGTGVGGFSGDGEAAKAAQLNFPEGVAVDALGNVYIADSYNERIRKITATTKVISTIAGTTRGFDGDGDLATAAQLSTPANVALDSSGNVYIADFNNNRIRKITFGSNGVEAIAPPSTIVAAYPNPTTGIFVLVISKVRAGATILVTDVAGNIRTTKTILRGELPTVTLDLTGFAKGMYLVQIRDGELNYRTKIVVQ